MERYESLGLVGEGSYGTVLKCRHRDSGRLVAIKKFMDSDDDKTVKKIALREIKLLRQLRHDNLVNLLEVWKRRRRWYLVFEFVERTLLDDLEQNSNGLDLNTSRQHLYQILRATAFCHQQNIIHRDIKPENILISQGGVVKLCDFGFARTMASPAEGGIYTDYVATRWYRAPELLVGDTKYGKPVDVWAVGCLLIEMLTGQPLFPGDSDLDQIYHIVRFFGNLTAHHQELFYRNPVFSGVRLPECPSKIPLEHRFPTITPTALDLAQDCLQMDPDRRAQCSELLEHPLFTHDSFQIRFLDELNAKIQKDHRENSTLPKITKAPRRERDEEDERNRRGKDKKQSEDLNEKAMKEKEQREKKEEEKMEKTKGKQPSKLSKTIRNTSEPLMSTKQSKTLGAKVIDNATKTAVTMKSKLVKATGAELRKELEISKSTKTLKSNSSEATKNTTDLKDNNIVAAKPKHGNVTSPEPREGHLKNMDTKDIDSSCSNKAVSIDYMMIVKSKPWRSSNSESSQEFRKSWNNTNTKVPKMSKSLTTDDPNGSSSPKAYLESSVDGTDTNITLKSVSSNDHTAPTMFKALNMTSTSEHQTDRLTMDTEQRKASDCPKALSSNPKPTKTTSNSGTKMSKNNTSSSNSLSKTLNTDLLTQLSTVHMETLTKGTSNAKFSKTSSTSTAKPTNNSTCVSNKPLNLPTDREHTEVSDATKNQQDSCNTPNKNIKKDGCLKMSPATKTPEYQFRISHAAGRYYKQDPESSEPSSIHQQSTSKSKIITESRTTSTSTLNEIPKTNTSVGSTIPKTLKVSDKENREDLALSLSISTTTKSSINHASKVSRSSSNEQKNNSSEAEPNMKFLKPPHSKSLVREPKTKLGTFSIHTRSVTMTPKTLKTTFPAEASKKSVNPERNDTTNISTIADTTSITSTATLDHRPSTRSSVFHSNMDSADIHEFDFSESTVLPPSPPPPPPPPSSTPLLLPPSSNPLIPSISAIGTKSPTASDQLSLGSTLQPGTHSLRSVDKPRHHGGIYSRLTQQSQSNHVTGSLTAQASSERSVTSERSFLSDRCNLGNSGSVAAPKRKSDIHFPDLRSSVLPDLRGREGKYGKCVTKDQRKDKHPVSSIPPSEQQQHERNSTDTNKS
ncbi:probable serine/threonine-protein kinase MARK-A isoform X1 [Thunnus albacares]|uniref:probable serine/threonine-protein kinase MARK-A isoform X1 n=1 Tax=Thunnus albacares TaxID=8236 RepID=UPI001CF6DB42|nr:probable serine/threonine-protein kinase MARK-A isoform X1 [Thunnus albacares]